MIGFAAGAGNKNVQDFVAAQGGRLRVLRRLGDPDRAPTTPTRRYSLDQQGARPEGQRGRGHLPLGGVTVTGARRVPRRATRSLYAYDDLDKFFARGAASTPIRRVESDEFVTIDKVQAKWQEIKAGA